MNITLESLIEDNWDQIKDNLKNKWDKLSATDVKHIEGSIDILIGKLRRAYGSTREDIKEEIKEFLTNEGIEVVTSKVKSIKKEISEKGESLRELSESIIRNYFEPLKERVLSLEDNFVSYAKNNPMEILGIATLTCLAIGKIWNYKK